MIVVTGAAGFIGSYFTGKLNREGFSNLILVDRFDDPAKERNLHSKRFNLMVDRDDFPEWLRLNALKVDLIFHLGARTDTIGEDPEIFRKLNTDYSRQLWEICTERDIPLIYASSAATYGNGEAGFSDAHNLVSSLLPLNLYARSKHDFDLWALTQKKTPRFWCGLKFFNVYGPNEYHKEKMASVVLHTWNAIKETGGMKLFRSHRDDIHHGEQKRDFVYVDDIAEVMLFFMKNRTSSGIYNVGTGKARSFLDLASAVFTTMKKEPDIEFIDIPEELQSRYQYFTEADIQKLREAGYSRPFMELEKGVEEYVSHFLAPEEYY